MSILLILRSNTREMNQVILITHRNNFSLAIQSFLSDHKIRAEIFWEPEIVQRDLKQNRIQPEVIVIFEMLKTGNPSELIHLIHENSNTTDIVFIGENPPIFTPIYTLPKSMISAGNEAVVAGYILQLLRKRKNLTLGQIDYDIKTVFTNMLRLNPNPIWITNDKGNIIQTNKSFDELTGYPHAEPEELDGWLRNSITDATTLNLEKVYEYDTQFTTRTGVNQVFEIKKMKINTQDNETQILAVANNVTENRHYLLEVLRKNAYIEGVFDKNTIPMMMVEMDNAKITAVNQPAYTILQSNIQQTQSYSYAALTGIDTNWDQVAQNLKYGEQIFEQKWQIDNIPKKFKLYTSEVRFQEEIFLVITFFEK